MPAATPSTRSNRPANSALWPALATVALSQIDPPAAGTLPVLLEQFGPFHRAVARAESALLLRGRGNTEADATLWTCSHLLQELLLLTPSQRLPLPLGLLAWAGFLVRQGRAGYRTLREIEKLNPRAPVIEFVGRWRHQAEMRASRQLPRALRLFGL